MGFRTYCNNKGCGKDMEPVLDTSSNEVECTECGRAITSITSFAKSQMKTLGQTKKAVKSTQAYAVNCKFCSKSLQPKIENGKVLCSGCCTHLDYLSGPYVSMLKEKLGSGKLKD